MKLLLFVLVLPVCLAVAGCSGSGSSSSGYSTPGSGTNYVTGNYVVTSLTNPSGSVTNCPGTLSWTGGSDTCGASDTIDFSSSGTEVLETWTSGGTQTGNYYITNSGTTLEIAWTSGEIDYFTLSWSGTTQTAGSVLKLVVTSEINPNSPTTDLEAGETVSLTYTGASPNVIHS